MSAVTPMTPSPQDLATCLTQPRAVARTPVGPVEYAERGAGPPLLSVHGTPGGCDQGLLIAELFWANGYRVIAPSRPGYLGTPLSSGRTVEGQAAALVALLDVLEVERAVVLGASGGGPSSYLLAARYPDRVSCLVEVDSVCLPLRGAHPWLERVAWSRAGVGLMLWLLDHHPRPLMKMFVGAPRSQDPRQTATQVLRDLDDPVLVALMRALTLSGSDWPTRRVGNDTDNEQFAALADLPLAAITAPTLILHGTADREVPPVHAEHAHAAITGSQLRWITDGAHLGFFLDLGAQQHTLAWMADQLRRSPTAPQRGARLAG